jgi:hypothetical protein
MLQLPTSRSQYRFLGNSITRSYLHYHDTIYIFAHCKAQTFIVFLGDNIIRTYLHYHGTVFPVATHGKKQLVLIDDVQKALGMSFSAI